MNEPVGMPWEAAKKKMLEDPEVRAGYEELGPEYEVACHQQNVSIAMLREVAKVVGKKLHVTIGRPCGPRWFVSRFPGWVQVRWPCRGRWSNPQIPIHPSTVL
jgi:hypothetical protein